MMDDASPTGSGFLELFTTSTHQTWAELTQNEPSEKSDLIYTLTKHKNWAPGSKFITLSEPENP